MALLYQTKIWQARLPDGWKVRQLLFDSATLFKPDGIGQILVMVVPRNSEFSNPNIESAELFSGKLHGFTITLKGGGSFSRLWWLSCKGRNVHVSYS
jgi:hypothetical protein